MFPQITLPVSCLVRSTLDETVTVLGSAPESRGALQEAVYGDRPVIATVSAGVYPESPAERIARDRTDTVQGYRVRVEADAHLADVTGSGVIRWDRSLSQGGPVVLSLDGPAVATPSGDFLDFTCSLSGEVLA